MPLPLLAWGAILLGGIVVTGIIGYFLDDEDLTDEQKEKLNRASNEYSNNLKTHLKEVNEKYGHPYSMEPDDLENVVRDINRLISGDINTFKNECIEAEIDNELQEKLIDSLLNATKSEEYLVILKDRLRTANINLLDNFLNDLE